MKRAVGVPAAVMAAAVVLHFQTRAPAPTTVRVLAEAPPTDSVARGKQLYESYGCAMCHGADAKGGFANTNAESEGKVPGLVMVKEGYLERELAQKILDGASHIGKADANGPTPPYRMPGWRDRMTRAEANDITRYLFSLYPKTAEDSWK